MHYARLLEVIPTECCLTANTHHLENTTGLTFVHPSLLLHAASGNLSTKLCMRECLFSCEIIMFVRHRHLCEETYINCTHARAKSVCLPRHSNPWAHDSRFATLSSLSNNGRPWLDRWSSTASTGAMGCHGIPSQIPWQTTYIRSLELQRRFPRLFLWTCPWKPGILGFPWNYMGVRGYPICHFWVQFALLC